MFKLWLYAYQTKAMNQVLYTTILVARPKNSLYYWPIDGILPYICIPNISLHEETVQLHFKDMKWWNLTKKEKNCGAQEPSKVHIFLSMKKELKTIF